MPTPVRRRRLITTPVEVQPDTEHKTKISTPKGGAEARVIQQVGDKTLEYEAQVEVENIEKQIEDEDFEGEGGISPDEIEVEIEEKRPLTPIETLFHNIRIARETRDLPDEHFIDSFSYSVRDTIDLGNIPFSIHDRFAIIPALQKLNNNSGGRFVLSVLLRDGKQLTALLANPNRTWESTPHDVWMKILIPEPTKLVIVNGNQNETVNENSTLNMLREMQRDNQAFQQRLFDKLTQEPRQDRFRELMEAKMLDMLMDKGTNGPNDIVTQILTTRDVIDKLGTGLSAGLFKHPRPEVNQTLIEQAQQVLAIPAVQDAIGRTMGVLEHIAVTRTNAAATAGGQPAQPVSQYQEYADDDFIDEPIEINPGPTNEEIMLTTIIDELESDRELDKDNLIINNLKMSYPKEFDSLTGMCKIMTLDQTVALVIDQMSKMTPSPILNYIEMVDGEAKWIEGRGTRMFKRLSDLYEFLKKEG